MAITVVATPLLPIIYRLIPLHLEMSILLLKPKRIIKNGGKVKIGNQHQFLYFLRGKLTI